MSSKVESRTVCNNNNDFCFIQATSWLFVAYIFLAQVLPTFDYEGIGVIAMKTQESEEQVGPIGVAFYKAFCVADLFVYTPLFVIGLLFQLSTPPPLFEAGKILLASAYGITMYWTIDCLAAIYYAHGRWELPTSAEKEYWTILPFIFLWGLICLVLLLIQDNPVSSTSRRNLHRQDNNNNNVVESSVKGFVRTCLVASGSFGPFFYLANDILQCSLNQNRHWSSTSISDLAAADTAHFVSQYLLLASGICNVLFGMATDDVWEGDVTTGGLFALLGFCNCLTATVFRLLSKINMEGQEVDGSSLHVPDISSLPWKSQMHVCLVGVSVLLTMTCLVRDAKHTKSQSHGWFTMVTIGLVISGVIGTFQLPTLVGYWERISVYSILLWTFKKSMDGMRRVLLHV